MPDLEIKIRTVLEGAGIKLTAEQLDQLSKSASAAEQGTKAAGGGISGMAREGVQGAESAKGLANELHHLERAGLGANEVMNGLAEGGLGGLTRAGRGAITTFRALATSVIGGTFLAAVTAAGAAIVIFRKMHEDNLSAMQEMWSTATHQTAAYKQGVEAARKQTESDFAKMRAEIKALGDSYNWVIDQIDKATARNAALTDARKAAELAGATTDEERTAIEAKYSARANENKGLNADLKESAANTQQEAAELKIRYAKMAVDKALRESQSATAASGQFDKTYRPPHGRQDVYFDNSPEAQAARTRAAIAHENYITAQSEYDKTAAAGQIEIDRTQEDIVAARNQREVAGINKGTISTTTANKVVATPSADPARIAALRQTAEHDQAIGDFAGQGKAVAQLREMTKAANSLAKSVVEHGATTTGALTDAAKKLKKKTEQLDNQRDSGAAGN